MLISIAISCIFCGNVFSSKPHRLTLYLIFAIVVWSVSHYCSGMKPNYQYEKRQRELEKKKKKAEKEHKKAVATEPPSAQEHPVAPQDPSQDKP